MSDQIKNKIDDISVKDFRFLFFILGVLSTLILLYLLDIGLLLFLIWYIFNF
jgi:hypothetical protein